MTHWTLLRLAPVAASLALHVAACGAIAMVPKFTAVRERVLVADLVEPDPTPPPAPARPARPAPAKPRDARRLTLPTPVAPRIAPPPPEATPQPPVPPPPVTQAPPPTPAPPAPTPAVESSPAPAVAVVPRVPARADATVASAGDSAPTASTSTPSSPATSPASTLPGASDPASRSVAALPQTGVTQMAAPRGGYQVRPSYPSHARRLGIQGTTLLSVFVAADGRVGDVVVRQSAGHPDLDQAAAEAVKRWRFEPARRGSEPVAMWVLLPVEFRLR